jgi:hypothetical protein
MSKRGADPRGTGGERWTARPAGGTSPEDRAGARLRQLGAPELPDDLALEKIRRRIVWETSARPARTAGPAWRRRVLVAVGACLLLAAGTAVARQILHLWPAAPAPSAAAPAAPPHAPAPARPAPLPPQELPAPAPAPSPSASGRGKRAAPARAPKERRTALLEDATPAAQRPTRDPPEADRAVPVPDVRATPEESALLARALTALRIAVKPRAALLLLDEYDRSYPHGGLRGEATLARIEAYLALADAASALRLLDRLALHTMPRAADAQVLRGELRSDAGRWREALADFDDVQSGAVPGALRERALYGQVVCLVRLARTDEARARAERYVATFPQGRFAGEMRRVAQPAAPAP